ncbi:MAG: LysR family transcriptional regulator [Rhodospirillaceae bacterium]|nr:LysR family transcriptional regulator [Rhodospirillaceae bacterium]
MVTLKQLNYLVSLAETRHFSKAAALCHVTQPALSTQIKELEQTLGFQVVERRRGAAQFTTEGQEVLRRATAIVAEARDLEDFAKQRRGLLVGRLTVGITPSIAPYLLPLCLPTIQSEFPRLDLKLRETQTDALVEELASGQVDVAILALPINRSGFDVLPLFDDKFLVAVGTSKAHGLPARLSADSIAPDQLLLLEEGHCLRDQALSYCNVASPKNLTTLGATSLNTVLQMVAAGYGMTLLPELVTRADKPDPRIVLKRFTAPEPKREVAMIWRATSPRTKDFKELGKLIKRCHSAKRAA